MPSSLHPTSGISFMTKNGYQVGILCCMIRMGASVVWTNNACLIEYSICYKKVKFVSVFHVINIKAGLYVVFFLLFFSIYVKLGVFLHIEGQHSSIKQRKIRFFFHPETESVIKFSTSCLIRIGEIQLYHSVDMIPPFSWIIWFLNNYYHP